MQKKKEKKKKGKKKKKKKEGIFSRIFDYLKYQTLLALNKNKEGKSKNQIIK